MDTCFLTNWHLEADGHHLLYIVAGKSTYRVTDLFFIKLIFLVL